MWWILLVLVLLTWATSIVFALDIAIPFATSVIVVLGAAALVMYRRIRSSRASAGLERAILDQGAQQASRVQPERRRELEELQYQIQSGIRALKSSKLGKGKVHGSAALYSLPWYVIIGPPGAGKTTALKRSGLAFSYAHPTNGGGVRGLGGTRNCDWWFTNEAILLDTAGRYTTEQDDHEEWIAFLQMLRKYRARRPLNGILVAVSVAELIDANEQHIEQMGKKLRARIDEVMTQLRMVLPVYLLFTKCDLIAGFTEFFGDMRKSDRAQAWGATLKLSADRADPGRLFDAEFGALAKQIHRRSLKRLVMERSREVRERVYQFSLEFSGIRRNLSDLVSIVFMVNPFQGTPIFRGFYFTSGAQEGKPLDRGLQRMGQAMGIRAHEAAAQQNVESKSYFLHDVFMNVVFPDGGIATRSASEIRRQRIVRGAISPTAAALGGILAIPGVVSFANNRELLREVEERARSVSALRWEDTRPLSEKLAALRVLRGRLREIDRARTEGAPLRMGFAMYQGEAVYPALRSMYASTLERILVIPCKRRLEGQLELARGRNYLHDRRVLMTYLMLRDVDHLDVDWATEQFTTLGTEILGPLADTSEAELRAQLGEHVGHYLSLVKKREISAAPLRDELVMSVRDVLRRIPEPQRYFNLLVDALAEERYGSDRIGRKYPPITLEDAFYKDPGALKVIGSSLYARERRWQEVEGPYTRKGIYAFLNNIARGAELVEQERWLVPIEKSGLMAVTPAYLDDVVDRYVENYIRQWVAWMEDIDVRVPVDDRDAVEIYTEIGRVVSPYLRILSVLEDNTQWELGDMVLDDQQSRDYLGPMDGQRPRPAADRSRVGIVINRFGKSLLRIRDEFHGTVHFGLPRDTGRAVRLGHTPLSRYLALLGALRDDVEELEGAAPGAKTRAISAELIEARRNVDALLQPLDARTRSLLGPLLLKPLDIAEVHRWRTATVH
ncbi:hypothetical protein BE08_22390 [Sorangium cellulosum]|uniref:Type VI secretion system membrane subunit TssM n=1 Tax=Sorangium cellulosum TaxID=56 RepID=A0A150NZ55_SORCE|nr:hypothetical protein BE08_22390 [Sorangium cellulosum]